MAGLLLLLIPVDRQKSFSFTNENCMGQGTWVYNRLCKDTTPIDIAFIGSSHIICGVNDSLLENRLTAYSDIHIANLGYCRLGRNLHHSLINELLLSKQPQYIILEVSERENRVGHPEFGYFARPGELLMPVWFYNPGIFTDIYNALGMRMAIMKKYLHGNQVTVLPPQRRYGYLNAYEAGNTEELAAKREKNKSWQRARGITRWWNNHYPLSYLERIKRDVETEGCKLLFLYLPAHGAISEPEEAEFYRTNGTLLIAPDSIYTRPEYWKDADHLNAFGADVLTEWLATELHENMVMQP